MRDKTLTSAFRCFGRPIVHGLKALSILASFTACKGIFEFRGRLSNSHWGGDSWCLVARFIYLIRIEHFFADYLPVYSPEEARPEASVARRFNLIHLDHKRIRITVN